MFSLAWLLDNLKFYEVGRRAFSTRRRRLFFGASGVRHQSRPYALPLILLASQCRRTSIRTGPSGVSTSMCVRWLYGLMVFGVMGGMFAWLAMPMAVGQSQAKSLNVTVVKHKFPQYWSNAYEAVKLPDALSGIRDAVQAAFGRDVRPVASTAAKFDIFNGIYLPSHPGDVFVNVASEVGFINIAGHEH